MVKIVAVLVALGCLPATFGASWTVCVGDRGSLLNAPIRAAVLREFNSVMGGRNARLAFESCPVEGSRILLAIEREPPYPLPGVLGLASRKLDRIQPNLLVFYDPLVRFLGEPNNSGAIGRALARVAAHETAHFLDQQSHHCTHGLLRSGFSSFELRSPSSRPFRTARRCREDEPPPASKDVSRGPGGETLRADAYGPSLWIDEGSAIR